MKWNVQFMIYTWHSCQKIILFACKYTMAKGTVLAVLASEQMQQSPLKKCMVAKGTPQHAVATNKNASIMCAMHDGKSKYTMHVFTQQMH